MDCKSNSANDPFSYHPSTLTTAPTEMVHYRPPLSLPVSPPDSPRPSLCHLTSLLKPYLGIHYPRPKHPLSSVSSSSSRRSLKQNSRPRLGNPRIPNPSPLETISQRTWQLKLRGWNSRRLMKCTSICDCGISETSRPGNWTRPIRFRSSSPSRSVCQCHPNLPLLTVNL